MTKNRHTGAGKKLVSRVWFFLLCFFLIMTSVPATTVSAGGSGIDWAITDGELVIESDAGMEDWIKNGRASNSNTVFSVQLRDGVTAVGGSAFYRFQLLIRVSLPSSVKTIGTEAFSYCRALSSVQLSEGTESIEYGAFADCTSLKSIHIPSSVTTLGLGVFQYCESLSTVTFSRHSRLSSVGSGAFFGCGALHYVALPDTVSYIGAKAFSRSGLEYIALPKNLAAIENELFSECEQLAAVRFHKHSRIESVGMYAFYQCSELHTLILPYGVLSIKQSAFTGSGLHYILLPATVTEIQNWAFENCGALKRVCFAGGMPATVGEKAFKGCTSLQRIYSAAGGQDFPVSVPDL